jgi:hypothetical protein
MKAIASVTAGGREPHADYIRVQDDRSSCLATCASTANNSRHQRANEQARVRVFKLFLPLRAHWSNGIVNPIKHQ